MPAPVSCKWPSSFNDLTSSPRKILFAPDPLLRFFWDIPFRYLNPGKETYNWFLFLHHKTN